MRYRESSRTILIATWTVLVLIGGPAIAQDPNLCDQPGEVPDLIMGGLDSVTRFGTVDDISAYSLGTTTCNIGSCWADWFATTQDHPVFTQNLYRLERGRFEQIGQSWVAHRFFALSNLLCSPICNPTNGTHLGVGCANANTAGINGGQPYLGPRSEIDPSTGIFPFPPSQFGVTGDSIYKRLQIRDDDLNPLWHPGAVYFIEGHSIAADDAAGGQSSNNASYRQVVVAPAGDIYNLVLSGPTHLELPAIEAWAALDPGVLRHDVDVPGDGRFHVASKGTPLGAGIWRYEYAVHNLDSHRAASRVSVPLPAGAVVTDPGFHDVDYHSGEPFDATDWAVTIDLQATAGTINWATEDYAVDPDANALRWSTLYNFRFDVAAPPFTGALTLGLFRPGSPAAVQVGAMVPQPCNANGTCEPGETVCGCSVDCGAHPAFETACLDATDEDCDGLIDCLDSDCCMQGVCSDADADGLLSCEDCNDDDAAIWSLPGAIDDLMLSDEGAAGTLLTWSAPAEPGATAVSFEIVRSTDPTDFDEGATCSTPEDPQDTMASDTLSPAPGELVCFVVRTVNGCPDGANDEAGRAVKECP